MSGREFTFAISLSVLNHLGRNLYRSFITVLGEAISNAWDADACNVHIHIDNERNCFWIKDDGVGMDADDFQDKFLKIGYSRRQGDITCSETKSRPLIGRKGIGKLALLSCADRITVISRKSRDASYTGGTIDNSRLDNDITDDLLPEEHRLEGYSMEPFMGHLDNHEHGTILYFENIKDGIRNTLDYLQKTIALYFRFSIHDESFKIYVNEEPITPQMLKKPLAQKTQFLWEINDLNDPYINDILPDYLKQEKTPIPAREGMRGFIASVEKPSNLKIRKAEEKISIDLFVNGRLREKDILRHVTRSRVAESYYYGQLHFDALDNGKDRFTSGREGIISDDSLYQEFLNEFGEIIEKINSQWDKFRLKLSDDPDPDSGNIRQKRALMLTNAVIKDYTLPEDNPNKEKTDRWIRELKSRAGNNIASYAECFIAENLIRNCIEELGIPLPPDIEQEIERFIISERSNMQQGNITVNIRERSNKLSYLDISALARILEPPEQRTQASSLLADAKAFRPFRNAIMHTALLSPEAKQRLITISDNIQGKIKEIFSHHGSDSDSRN